MLQPAGQKYFFYSQVLTTDSQDVHCIQYTHTVYTSGDIFHTKKSLLRLNQGSQPQKFCMSTSKKWYTRQICLAVMAMQVVCEGGLSWGGGGGG